MIFFKNIFFIVSLTILGACNVEQSAPDSGCDRADQAFTIKEPIGCRLPPNDYTKVTIEQPGMTHTLSRRTMAMLEHARKLYGGTIQITSSAILQGSYSPGNITSFGTHDGGGAVDLHVRDSGSTPIQWEDITPLINALRTAGFAAFFRDYREEMSPHIHAIAIGDKDLSAAAQKQLTGRYGYFRGYDGMPRKNKIPLTWTYGEFIMCNWMLDAGYKDLRGEPIPP